MTGNEATLPRPTREFRPGCCPGSFDLPTAACSTPPVAPIPLCPSIWVNPVLYCSRLLETGKLSLEHSIVSIQTGIPLAICHRQSRQRLMSHETKPQEETTHQNSFWGRTSIFLSHEPHLEGNAEKKIVGALTVTYCTEFNVP